MYLSQSLHKHGTVRMLVLDSMELFHFGNYGQAIW